MNVLGLVLETHNEFINISHIFLSFYTDVVVKKKSTTKKRKNIKKEVKKTTSDYFLDEAEEWIDHGELVRDKTETLSSNDVANDDYCNYDTDSNGAM